ADATLVWSEATRADTIAVDGIRDKVMMLTAPFSGAPVTLASVGWRASTVLWARPDLAIVREGWQRTRTERYWVVNPSQPTNAPRLLWERSTEDRYGDPGAFVTTTDARGQTVLKLTADGRATFLQGNGASSEGDRPFV